MLQVYAAYIDKSLDTEKALQVMSEERRGKYCRLKNDLDRKRCAAVALLLHLARPKSTERFDRNGCPSLGDEYVSISHSGEWAVVAVSDKAVGVDIEKIRPANISQIASRCFSDDEMKDLDSEKFFGIWVCRESAAKSVGLGLAAMKMDISDKNFITLNEFPGYAAAVCTEYKEYEISYLK